jgi:hypothetical protein
MSQQTTPVGGMAGISTEQSDRIHRWQTGTESGESIFQQRLIEDSEDQQSVASSMDLVEILNTTEPPKDEPEDVLTRPIPDWLLRGQETGAQRRERHRTEKRQARDRR